jgi:hypothetical protein
MPAANAGPPFRTDDPEPVEFGHYEFYMFSTGTHVRGETSGVAPGFEFNYGLIPNGQFHIVAPLAFDRTEGEPGHYGYGDTELGFKYRFIEEDKNGWRPQVAVFPLLELPTGSEKQGLGAGHTRVFPCGCRKASAIGPPMAAAATGSTTATSTVIRTTGMSAGSCSAK